MEAFFGRQRLILPIAPAVALVAAGCAALAVLAMPVDVLEDMVTDSGVAALVTAAAPPLGLTARLAITFLAALLIGGLLWFGLGLLLGNRSIVFNRRAGDDGVPVLRRADAHPDAPPRQPVFANRDLGTPFLDVHAEPRVTGERPLPSDLDTPLSAYLHPLDAPLPAPEEAGRDGDAPSADAPLPIWLNEAEVPPALAAQAIAPPEPEPELEPEAPRPAPEPVAEEEPSPVTEPRFAAHERIETFELTPINRGDAPPPAPAGPSQPSQPSATIHDLLARLERGVARRAPVAPAPAAVVTPAARAVPAPSVSPMPAPSSAVSPESIEQTLAVLRQLATRVG